MRYIPQAVTPATIFKTRGHITRSAFLNYILLAVAVYLVGAFLFHALVHEGGSYVMRVVVLYYPISVLLFIGYLKRIRNVGVSFPLPAGVLIVTGMLIAPVFIEDIALFYAAHTVLSLAVLLPPSHGSAREQTFIGFIYTMSRNPNVIEVDKQTGDSYIVRTTPSTELVSNNGDRLLFTDLKKRTQIEVTGYDAGGKMFVARSIRILDDNQ